MSLGLPVHLVPHSAGRAFALASHTVAFLALGMALASALMYQVASPSVVLWPGAVSLVPMFFLLWLLGRLGTNRATMMYLALGGVSVFLFVLACMQFLQEVSSTNAFILTVAKVSLVTVGNAHRRALPTIGWAIAGYAIAEGVTALAAVRTGTPIVLDRAVLMALALSVFVRLVLSANRRHVERVKPGLHRAARDEHLSEIRARMEAKAAALLHDTVLNHLAAVAASPSGPLRNELAQQVRRDVEQLLGEEWLIDDEDSAVSDTAVAWQSTTLAAVIDGARRLGLEIEVSGDRMAIARLAAPRAGAVALAVKQCLVNVARHAGTDNAEVVIIGSEHEVSIMVIDTGKGFLADNTAADRLGIRHSVHSRIEAVGGSVRVWSTPGRGTSVLIRVPAAATTTTPVAASP